MSAPDRAPIIEKLFSTLHETMKHFDQPVAAQNRSYGPGKWTLKEILVHLSDTETVLLDRLRRLLAEENPVLMAFDENRWASNLTYKLRNLSIAKAQYDAARRSIIEIAQTSDASAESKIGTHSEKGTRTFTQVLSMVAEHNAHHLGQIRAIAENRTWSKDQAVAY